MNRSPVSAAVALCLALPVLGHALQISAGTAEYVTFRDCIAGVTGCDSTTPILYGQFGGSPGAYSSFATLTVAGYGTATGSVSLSAAAGAPILRAGASSEDGKRLNTNSLALQSYTYRGSETTTRTFGGTLTYSQTLSGAYPNDGGVFAVIDAFTLPTSTVDVGDTAASNFDTIDSLDFPGYVDLASNGYADTGSNASGSGSFGVTLTLTPGETVWLWVLLQTAARERDGRRQPHA